MEQITESSAGSAPAVSPYEQRKKSLVDILYLLLLTWLYLLSLVYPLVGIVLGIVLLTWATTEDVKRVGKVCLILGIVNVVLVLIVLGTAIAIGGFMASLPFSSHWGHL